MPCTGRIRRLAIVTITALLALPVTAAAGNKHPRVDFDGDTLTIEARSGGRTTIARQVGTGIRLCEWESIGCSPC